MTRKELQLREQIACVLYKSRQEDLILEYLAPMVHGPVVRGGIISSLNRHPSENSLFLPRAFSN